MFLQRIPFQHHGSQTRTTSRRRASRLVSSIWQYLAILLASSGSFSPLPFKALVSQSVLTDRRGGKRVRVPAADEKSREQNRCGNFFCLSRELHLGPKRR